LPKCLELGLLPGLPASRIDGQLLPVLLEHIQKALIIVLVVALQLCLQREVLHFGPDEALQPAQEARISWIASVCSSLAFAPPGGPGGGSVSVVHDITFFLIGNEVASRVFGKAGIHLDQEFSEFAVGAELLAARGGRERDAIIDSKILSSSSPVFAGTLEDFFHTLTFVKLSGDLNVIGCLTVEES
jgi:hypothetical protein